MGDVLRELLARLERGESVVLARVLRREGDAPRSAGSRMLLAAGADGEAIVAAGSVGGGKVEALTLAAGSEVLASGGALAPTFGEVGACGGRTRVFLERLAPAELPGWRRLAAALGRGASCLRLAPLEGGGATLLLPEGVCGFVLASGLEAAAREAARGRGTPVLFVFAGREYALEVYAAPTSLFIFGAGHVGRAVARLAATCGFATTVLDDRPEFLLPRRFPHARVRRLKSLETGCSGLRIGSESFVLIAARGHAEDATLLASVLRTPAGYVGMLGSDRKREAVFARLRGEGFAEGDLARVHCPVGLDIGAETPEEIAVSIVAEMIRERSRRSE